jgi:hypothetical protein
MNVSIAFWHFDKLRCKRYFNIVKNWHGVKALKPYMAVLATLHCKLGILNIECTQLEYKQCQQNRALHMLASQEAPCRSLNLLCCCNFSGGRHGRYRLGFARCNLGAWLVACRWTSLALGT